MEGLSREVRLVSRPNGASTHSNFEIVEVELQPLGSAEVRVRNTWMSVDPYMRGRMRDYESYLPPFQIGKALEGMAVGFLCSRSSQSPSRIHREDERMDMKRRR
jgi:NADPH-dependent curcumin reductase CurA